MTYLQAVQEALRRQGFNEAEIKDCTDKASLNLPGNFIHHELSEDEASFQIIKTGVQFRELLSMDPKARAELFNKVQSITQQLHKLN